MNERPLLASQGDSIPCTQEAAASMQVFPDCVVFQSNVRREEMFTDSEFPLAWKPGRSICGTVQFMRRGRLGTAAALTARICHAPDVLAKKTGIVGAYKFNDKKHTFDFSASKIWSVFMEAYGETVSRKCISPVLA